MSHLHGSFGSTELYPEIPQVKVRAGSSPRLFSAVATSIAAGTPTAGAARKIAIAVDLSDESAYAVKWAVDQYLRPGDAVVLLHVRPTSILYGADWGCVDMPTDGGDGDSNESQQKLESDFDAFTSSKAADLARPLIEAKIPYKIHIVKDHDMKERLCLEVERMGFNAVIMGSRGFGATRRESSGRLGSVSDYCVRHCICPVVVVRYPDGKEVNVGTNAMPAISKAEEKGVAEQIHNASEENNIKLLHRLRAV